MDSEELEFKSASDDSSYDYEETSEDDLEE